MIAEQRTMGGQSEREALITTPDGRRSTGTLRVISAELLTVAFSMKGDQSSSHRLVGDTIILTLTGSGTKIEAEIVSASLMGYIEVCQFRAVRHLEGPALQLTGERRGSVRHRPKRPTSVSVTPIGRGLAAINERGTIGFLGDVSAGGCGIELTKGEYRALGSMTKAALRFRLPGHDEDVEFLAERKNTRTAGTEKIWMGLSWLDDQQNDSARTVLSSFLSELGS